MLCIYCGGKTRITNSRPQKALNQTWRRHRCTECLSVFTTEEVPALGTDVRVRGKNGSIAPFSRDKLLISMYRAVGHRKTAVDDAGALAATVVASLTRQGALTTLTHTEIARSALKILKRFDTAAAVQYAAYHKD